MQLYFRSERMAAFLSFCSTCFVDFLHINDFIAFLHCTVSSICLTNLCLNRLWNLNHKTKWGRRLSYGFTADMFLFWKRHHCNCTGRTHNVTDHTMKCFTNVLTVFDWFIYTFWVNLVKNGTTSFAEQEQHKDQHGYSQTQEQLIYLPLYLYQLFFFFLV